MTETIKEYHARRITELEELGVAIPNDLERIGDLLAGLNDIKSLTIDWRDKPPYNASLNSYVGRKACAADLQTKLERINEL